MLARLRDWWKSSLDWQGVDCPDASGWFVSLTVHVAALVILAIAYYQLPRHDATLVLSSTETLPLDALQLPAAASDAPQEMGAAGDAGLSDAVALATNLDVISQTPRDIDPVEVITPTMSISLSSESPTAPQLDEHLVIKGEAGEAISGAAGAIDRLTQEILRSLEQRPTLVVWIFDQSASLQPQREDIHARFDRVYEELGALEQAGNEAFAKHGDTPLLSSVVSFGQDVSFLTPNPTANVDTVKQAVSGIQNDPSGIEHVFNAVLLTAERYKRFRQTDRESERRNVLIVIFTDECGDDQDQADRATMICQRLEMPVYVVGVPAPFGREEILVRFRDPDPNFDQSDRYLPVRQGPETALPEHVRLAFLGSSESDDEFNRLDSGFGPYALTRLCYETGGIYFALHPNNKYAGGASGRTALMASSLTQFFDPDAMRSYRPEYVPLSRYNALVRDNRACSALVEAAQLSQVEAMRNPRFVFPVRNEAQLKQDLDIAQRDAAILEPRLRSLHEVLQRGAADRSKLTSLRWQAGYDLALGRVLAARVRTESYNAMLAKAEQGMQFQNPDSDTWVLRAKDEITVGSALEKMAQQARTLLEGVIDKHPGTPWALLAKRELRDPIGWTWTERHTGVNDPPPPPPSNAPPPMPRPNNDPPPPPPKPVRDIRL